MKRLLLLAVLFAPLRLLAAPDAIATPATLSYQGKIANASGALIGGGGTPVNQDLTFRIWTSSTSTAAADRLWSEKITTTVSEGEFSVMLGSGDTVQSETNQRASFAEVFAGQNSVTTTPSSAKRYLGITIGTGTDEIFPRQEIVTTAFAFRAKVAESVAATAVTTAMIANGAVTNTQLATDAVTNSKLTGQDAATPGTTQVVLGAVSTEKIQNVAVTAAKIADGAVTTAKLAGQDAATPGATQVVLGAVSTEKIQNVAVTNAKLAGQDAATPGNAQVVLGAVSTAKIQNGAVTTAKIADGHVTAAKLASDVSGFWSVAAASGGNPPPSVYRATGKVGIGVTAPPAGSDLPSTAALLQVRNRPVDVGTFTDSPSVWIGSATHNGGKTITSPETALLLSRAGVAGDAYANLARFDIGRWDTSSGTSSRTQLDIRLSDGDLMVEGNNTPPVMSLKSDGSVAVAGIITSPRFWVTEVLPYQPGSTDGPVRTRPTASYSARGGRWLVTATCTGLLTVSGSITASLKVNGVEIGTMKMWCSAGVHCTLTRQFLVKDKSAGTYTIGLTHNGLSDLEDYSQVTILELPF
jgi:hypothetical protein